MTHLVAVLNASSRVAEAVVTLRREGARPPPLVAGTLDRLADAIAAGGPLHGGPLGRGPHLDGTPLDMLRSIGQHWAGEHLHGHHGIDLHWTGQQGDGQQGDGQQGDSRDKDGGNGCSRDAGGPRIADQQSPEPLYGVPPIPPPWSPSPGSVELRDALAALARTIAWTPATPPESARRTSLRDRARAVLASLLDQLRGGRLVRQPACA